MAGGVKGLIGGPELIEVLFTADSGVLVGTVVALLSSDWHAVDAVLALVVRLHLLTPPCDGLPSLPYF